ncbi:hypothetical protein DI43_15495 [Geobacillus sp. CAMR12739]|nr:hypothetical protein DI43_15495 [Geobacillus sp. CAMR12739]
MGACKEALQIESRDALADVDEFSMRNGQHANEQGRDDDPGDAGNIGERFFIFFGDVGKHEKGAADREQDQNDAAGDKKHRPKQEGGAGKKTEQGDHNRDDKDIGHLPGGR